MTAMKHFGIWVFFTGCFLMIFLSDASVFAEDATTDKELVVGKDKGVTIEAPKRLPNVYAVIIGIGDYEDGRIPDIRFTVNDAQGLYDVLTDPNYGGVKKDHIKLLLDKKATEEAKKRNIEAIEATENNIEHAIGVWLERQATEDDTVIIYYSGHGASEGNDTYWVTSNADIDSLFSTALKNNDIAEMLDRIKSKRIITFVDSCYSAATVNRTNQTRDLPTEIPWGKFTGEGRVIISASNGRQRSLELDEYEHGVFTYYLLEALKGGADEGGDCFVDVDEIWDYVKKRVTNKAIENGNNQTPVLQGEITAGIPLTYNAVCLHQKEREALQKKREEQQKIKQKLDRLTEFYEQKVIPGHHFDCAYNMLTSGKSNVYLEDLLSGDISPGVFNKKFKCSDGSGEEPPPPPNGSETDEPWCGIKCISTLGGLGAAAVGIAIYKILDDDGDNCGDPDEPFAIVEPQDNAVVNQRYAVEVKGVGMKQDVAEFRCMVYTNNWYDQTYPYERACDGSWSTYVNLGGQGEYNNHRIRVEVFYNDGTPHSAEVQGISVAE